ncbi:MAG: FecR domain-containing protein [Spirochaetia bacterium]|nr:FecR domain-containing protein [Spirochaetia bacterium]
MKRIILISSMVLLAYVLPAQAQEKQSIALILSVKGSVTVNKTPAKANGLLRQGDTMETGDGAAASVGPKSVVKLVKLDRQGDTLQMQMDLSKGSVATNAGKLPPKSNVQINAPTAIAGVRGTEFIVEAGSDKANVLVNDGSVAVTDSAGKGEEVAGPGQAVTATATGLQVRIMEQFEKQKFQIMEEMRKSRKANLDALVDQIKRNEELIQQQKDLFKKP